MDIPKFLKTDVRPGPGEFLHIDMAELVDKLDLRKRGAERGAVGLPRANSSSFDEFETEITEAIRTYALAEERRTFDQLTLYSQRLQSADPNGTAADLRAIATQSINQFEAEIAVAKNDLQVANASVRSRRKAVERFQIRNQLDRPVELPSNHYFLAGVLMVLFLLEAVPNTVLLSAGDEDGFLGAFSIVILASGLNLALSFMSGYFFWTNAKHRDWVRRIAGTVCGLISIAIIVLLNLSVAHFRDAVTAGATTSVAAVQVTQSFLILSVHDVISGALAIFGGVFAVIATIDGYKWNDPYPGYTKITRSLAKAEALWSMKVDQRINLLDGVQQRQSNELKAVRASLRDRYASIPDIGAQRSRLINNFTSHLEHLQGVGRYALAAYRDANRAARTAENPAPERFDFDWELKGISIPRDQEMPSPIKPEEWQAANSSLEESMEKLQAAFRSAIDWIRDLDNAERPSQPTDPNTPHSVPKLVIDGRAA